MSIIAAMDVIGLLIDAIRNSVSRVIGVLAAMSRQPMADACTISPRRHTSVDAPARLPESTIAWIVVPTRSGSAISSPRIESCTTQIYNLLYN